MKKTSFACLALAVPFLALTACTAVNNLALSANWYSRTNSTVNANTREELRYLVLFESSDGNNFLSYGEGSYTTVLSAENTVLAGGENETCYHLTSTLNIPVLFSADTILRYLSGSACSSLVSSRRILPAQSSSVGKRRYFLHRATESEYLSGLKMSKMVSIQPPSIGPEN